MNPLNRIIVKSVIEGLVWTVGIFSYTFAIFSMSFPGVMANLYDAVGNTRLSAMYHSRVYQRNPTPENLFFALDRNLANNNDRAVIKYGTRFFIDSSVNAIGESERNRIITQVDNFLVERAGTDALTIATATNTDDRLRRGFIRALLNRGYNDVAWDMFEYATEYSPEANLARPSFAVFEFPRTFPRIDEVDTRFIAYFDSFEQQLQNTPPLLNSPEYRRARFFVNNAMTMFNEASNV